MARLSRVKLIVLVVVLLLLGAYVFLWELGDIKKPQENPESEKIIYFNLEDVREIEIVLTNKRETVAFIKKDTRWRVTKPLEASADPGRVEDLLSIFDYGYVEVIDEGPSDLSPYGLDNPEVRLTIAVSEKGRLASYTLLFGSNNPTNNSCYCMVKDDPRILLVGVLYKQDLEKHVSFYGSSQGFVGEKGSMTSN
jgi:hypothetical protein